MFVESKEGWKNKNNLRKEKNMQCVRGKFYFFASCLLRSVEAPELIKPRYTVQHCLMKFEFHDY